MGENEDLYVESEAEETLSFCDLPLGGDWEDHSGSIDYDYRRPSHEELFEFFNDLSSEMRVAEDIVFCGKLLPHSSPALYNYSNKDEKITEDSYFDFTRDRSFRGKPDSLRESQRSKSSVKVRFDRSDCSLDYKKLKRATSSMMTGKTSPVMEVDRIRIPASKRLPKSDSSFQKSPVSSSPSKPRWNLFMFGLMKSPSAMKLGDIRNRQSRRNPSSMFPSFKGEETVSVRTGREKGSSSWGLLRALGCKGHVRATLGCIPPVLY